jgi:hypothetical protein
MRLNACGVAESLAGDAAAIFASYPQSWSESGQKGFPINTF